MLVLLVLLLIASCLESVLCVHNVTVDDPDPSILYNPKLSWGPSAQSILDAGGSHMLTSDPKATATFTFIGVAIYFMSPLWPYHVTTLVTLDGSSSTLLNLTDPAFPDLGGGIETKQSSIVWGMMNLLNTTHTLVVSVGVNEPYAIVDTFIYTVLDPPSIAPTSSSTSPPSSSSSSTLLPSSSSSSSFSSNSTSLPSFSSNSASLSSSSSTSTSTLPSVTTSFTATRSSALAMKRVLPILLGTVLGFVALALVIFGIWFYRQFRRLKRPSKRAILQARAASLPLVSDAEASLSGNTTNMQTTNLGPLPGATPPARVVSLPYSYMSLRTTDGNR